MLNRYRYGERLPIPMPVKASEVWTAGDLISLDSSGYAQACAAGERAVGVAMESITTTTTPSADGGATILVDQSPLSVYEYPVSAGSITQALAGKTCDVGGVASIDITASADDCILIRRVDTDAATVFVSIIAGTVGGVA